MASNIPNFGPNNNFNLDEFNAQNPLGDYQGLDPLPDPYLALQNPSETNMDSFNLNPSMMHPAAPDPIPAPAFPNLNGMDLNSLNEPMLDPLMYPINNQLDFSHNTKEEWHQFGLNCLRTKEYDSAARYFEAAAIQGYAEAMIEMAKLHKNKKFVMRDESIALKYCMMAVNLGHSEAQLMLAEWYEEGMNSLPKDMNKALEFYEKSAKLGNVRAHYSLGNLYLNGIGVEIDYKKALEHFTLSAKANHADSQLDLGYMYEKGLGVPIDFKQAIQWYELSASQNNTIALCNLGLLYSKEGILQDYQKSQVFFEKAAMLGSLKAQHKLGLLYLHGSGGAINYAKALEYLKMSADSGYAEAAFELGSCYTKGLGGEINFTEACRYYQIAADKGNASAQYNLGLFYQNGKKNNGRNEIEKDSKKAFECFQQAANSRHAGAIFALGQFFENGFGVVEVDLVQSNKLYQESANLGNLFAITSLGYHYLFGIGVEKNAQKAYQLFLEASEKNHKPATDPLNGYFCKFEIEDPITHAKKIYIMALNIELLNMNVQQLSALNRNARLSSCNDSFILQFPGIYSSQDLSIEKGYDDQRSLLQQCKQLDILGPEPNLQLVQFIVWLQNIVIEARKAFDQSNPYLGMRSILLTDLQYRRMFEAHLEDPSIRQEIEDFAELYDFLDSLAKLPKLGIYVEDPRDLSLPFLPPIQHLQLAFELSGQQSIVDTRVKFLALSQCLKQQKHLKTVSLYMHRHKAEPRRSAMDLNFEEVNNLLQDIALANCRNAKFAKKEDNLKQIMHQLINDMLGNGALLQFGESVVAAGIEGLHMPLMLLGFLPKDEVIGFFKLLEHSQLIDLNIAQNFLGKLGHDFSQVAESIQAMSLEYLDLSWNSLDHYVLSEQAQSYRQNLLHHQMSRHSQKGAVLANKQPKGSAEAAYEQTKLYKLGEYLKDIQSLKLGGNALLDAIYSIDSWGNINPVDSLESLALGLRGGQIKTLDLTKFFLVSFIHNRTRRKSRINEANLYRGDQYQQFYDRFSQDFLRFARHLSL